MIINLHNKRLLEHATSEDKLCEIVKSQYNFLTILYMRNAAYSFIGIHYYRLSAGDTHVMAVSFDTRGNRPIIKLLGKNIICA